MSSPLNDPSNDPFVTDWFRRFDAAARHLPAEDRAVQHEELRQHLDALAAANVASGQSPEAAQQNALTRLGDPSHIGRKLDREWQQGRTGFRADMKAIGFGVGFSLLVYLVITLTALLWHGKNNPSLLTVTFAFYMAFLRCVAIGLIYPQQAIRASLYSYLLDTFSVLLMIIWIIGANNQAHLPSHHHSLWPILAETLFSLPRWMITYVATAYLASVTRRGWYRPSLADFKLNLPKKKARA